MSSSPPLTPDDLHRLNRLLAEGLEREGAERTAWLNALGADDQHLREVLIDLLCQSAGEDRSFDPPTHIARVAADAIAAMQREQPGDRIGPWQLDRLLAEGGMGAVWLAQRADGVLKRTAALKLPRAGWVDHGLAQRITRERAILARLTHPNIALLYDAGVTAEGRPYLALEYVDGMPIDTWCRGRDLARLLRLFIQVARAVAHAHAHLVIHRDLKPANVLVTADGLPKLLDFGISKLIEGDQSTVDATALTRLAGRPMTVAYAAPEQLLGLPVTVAADVYALGVLLFELLAGARLYRASTAHALEAEILRGDLRRPSDAAVDPARTRALRGDLDAIVATALKRDPAQRYQGAAALADDLERHLDGKPVRARPDSRGYRLRKFVVRNALPVAAGAAVVVALGAGLGVALWQGSEAREQARRATALNAFVLGLIQQADPNASPQTREADVSMLKAIEQRVDAEFDGAPDQLLQLRVTVAEAYRNRGEMMAARRVFQRAFEEASPHVPHDDVALLTAIVRGSDTQLIVSTRAAEQLEHVIPVLRARSEGSSAVAALLIDALLARFDLVMYYGLPAYATLEELSAITEEARQVAVQHFGAGSRVHLRAIGPTVALQSLRTSGTGALRLLEDALAQARGRGDGTDRSMEFLVATALHAGLRCAIGEVGVSLDTLWRLAADVRSAHGPTSYALEPILLAVGECMSTAGDATAFGWRAEAFEVAAARERPPSPNLMRRAMDAFNWAAGARDERAAELYYQHAIRNAEAIPEVAVRDRLTIGLRATRVCQLAQRGEPTEAEREAMPLVAMFNAEFEKVGRLTPNQGTLWICYSDALRQLGRHDEALHVVATYEERCRLLRGVIPVGVCELRAMTLRALIELESGRIADAQRTVARRLELSPDEENDPRWPLAYGRILIATGRAGEAIEPLRKSYGTWLSMQPRSPYATEALYWFGRAYLAVGDVRGRWMVEQARRQLARSPVSFHRALATGMPH